MNTIEKKYAKSAQKFLIFESGLAVSEMRQAKVEVLQIRMAEQYKSRLLEFNPVSDENIRGFFTGKSYAYSLRDRYVEDFKKSIDDIDGKKMWKWFTNIKSEKVNHWLPHLKLNSGEDFDDALERVRCHAWAYRANRAIRRQNKKAELEQNIPEEEKTFEDAPKKMVTCDTFVNSSARS